MKYPEDALDKLAAEHGLQVMIDDGADVYEGCQDTYLRLLAADGRELLTVKEPPGGWPVTVTQRHAATGETTTFVRCGDGHCPNTPHPDALDPDAKFSRADFERIDKQKGCTPIDTPAKLHQLCEQLLGHPEAKAIRAKGERAAKRAARRPGPPEQAPAPK